MHYGHPQHVHKPTDLMLLKCNKCGWISAELTREQRSALGIPWYCGGCGKSNPEYVIFAPEEREAAYGAIGRKVPA